ncbi:MAG: radical SAM protein [Deltaproteobacteria bacterium]|nr:radical SAM protein [Deltaproteobacteria bacterium]
MAHDNFLYASLKKVLHIPEKIPPFVQIAVTNLCNKDCKMCIRFQVPIEQRHMPLADFKTIVDRIRGARAVTLVGMGEPLLYPELIEAIRYCRLKGLDTRLTTNGILLRQKAAELVEAGLGSIHVSMENVRQEELKEDLLNLMGEQEKRGKNTPEIVLQPILFEDPGRGRTVQDVYDVISWAAEHGIKKVNIARVDKRTDPTMQRPGVEQEQVIFRELAKLRRQYRIRIDCLQDQVYSGLKGKLYKFMKPLLRLDSFCYRLLDYVYIDVNGNVHPCPIDMGQIMGNIFQESLEEIWHGERFSSIRENQQKYAFCRKCDFLKLKQINGV